METISRIGLMNVMETYSRIELLKCQGNLQSYWTTPLVWGSGAGEVIDLEI
jgi:hypothetical protein